MGKPRKKNSAAADRSLTSPPAVETALGFLETRGYAALTRATDAMHKAAAVERLDTVQIGSAYATILTVGAVAAVQAAVEAGLAELKDHKGLVGAHVIPAPHREILNRFARGVYDGQGEFGGALGLIETKGLSGLIIAHDAALKAAQVTTEGFFALGSGLVAVILRGDVAAIKAGVGAGVSALADGAGELHARLVVPSPSPGLVPALIGSAIRREETRRGAIGIIETRGYVAAFAAADAALKAAAVGIECWKKIGGGMVSVTVGGEVAAVKAAVAAGCDAAQPVAEVLATLIVPRPHESVYISMP